MKRRLFVIILSALLLCTATTMLCYRDTLQLRWEIDHYQVMLEDEIPEDLTLTICYLPNTIITRYPLTIERLNNMEGAVKIVVPADTLANHVSVLKKLTATSVHCAKEEPYPDVLFYYVFEQGDKKVLEVVMHQYSEDGETVVAYVNGIAVEEAPVLSEIVQPFLSEDDWNNMWH